MYAKTCDGRTSGEKSSSGAASIALMVSLLLGCTVAKPPETRKSHPDKIKKAGERKDEFSTPNHFFDEPALSITSTMPGRRGSMDGT